MSDLSTPRLSLIPFPHALMMALVKDSGKDNRKGNEYFAAGSGLQSTPDWPNSDLRDAMPFIAATVEAEPMLEHWMRLFVLKDSGLVIGEAGFKGLPDAEGAVEIGYGIAQSHRGRGLATEAVLAMCEWAFHQSGVRAIKAECLAENSGSIGVLGRSGFIQANSDAAMLRWELPRRSGR